ncbi:MAG: hypothetical protein IKR11_07860 [Solobacterium sp.]|nr:hypothetical protein [Solobacterium sp.]
MKKILRDHVFFKLIIITLFVTVPMYIYNVKRSDTFSYINNLYSIYDYYEEQAETNTVDSEYFTRLRDSSASVIEAYENKEWKTLNASYLEYLNIERERNPYTYESELELNKSRYLAKTDIQKEDSDQYPVSGVNFMVECSKIIYPYLFILFSCYVLSLLFDSNSKKNKIETFSIGMICLISGGFILHLIPYLIGTIGHGSSSLQYPYLWYEGYKAVYHPLTDFILPGICLIMFISVFLYEMMHIIYRLTNHKTISFLTGTVLSVSILYGIQNLQSLHQISQYIPFTYLQLTDIISGNLAFLTSNYALTFIHGMICIGIGILIETGILFLIKKHRRKIISDNAGLINI